MTGGTDGIGKAYAAALAARGFGICIISRNVEKLETVAEEIEARFGVPTVTVRADFCGETGPEVYGRIAATLDKLPGGVGVLVNNVGMSYRHAEYFHVIRGGRQVLFDLIASNVTACTMMLHLVLPGMLERRKGLVVNVSSLTAVYPMPLLSVYSACKAYVDYLSRALHYEYCDQGIFVQSLLPGYVATKMSHRRPSLEVPSPEDFVASAIQTVGEESYSYGYLPHKIRGFIHEWLRAYMPACVNLAIARYFMKRARDGYILKLWKKWVESHTESPFCLECQKL